MKLPKPDVTLFLDMPVEFSSRLAKERKDFKSGTAKDILEEDENHIKKAYIRAKYVAEKFNWIKIPCVDQTLKSIDEIHKEILTKLGI